MGPASDQATTTLVRRVREELSAMFTPERPMRVSRAPGRLDVMGGIADYTGSLVCEMPIEQSAAVATQERTDRNVSVVGLNLLDEHKPFQFQMPLDALAATNAATLRAQLHESLPDGHGENRAWAGYVIGCLKILSDEGLLDLASVPGLNLALYSTVPSGAGVSSSAAVEVATMMNLVGRFGLDQSGEIDGPQVAVLCQRVENEIVGAPCGLMDQMASVMGEAGKLMRMVCQPHELLEPLALPDGVRVVGINSNVKHSVGGGAYGKTRTAAFMGHTLILDAIRKMAAKADKEMIADPTGGYLANVDPDDYKRHFRPLLPEHVEGGAFLDEHGDTADPITTPKRGTFYHVQAACDHHVLEARRVKQFAAFLGAGHLDKAGHLMYASHHSYTTKAQLGADECDVLVDLVRKNEPAGFHGAKITGGGSGGTVAVLCKTDTDDALAELMAEYEKQTGLTPDLIAGTSAGAWETGSWEI
ncbi:MAG: galactokinase family protein [Planctomycetota bacterium]